MDDQQLRAQDAWQRLGEVEPLQLGAMRLQLHHAAALVAAVGHSLLPASPDFSQEALTWLVELGALAGATTPDPPSSRAALQLATGTLLLLDEGNHELGRLELHGRSMDEALRWLGGGIARFGGRPLGRELRTPDHELPDHDVGRGGVFDLGDGRAATELAAWFNDAAALFQGLREGEPAARPVRTWPHHFDIAVLIDLDPGVESEEARSIGVGLSPGDGSYAEPYWYVLPWPRPAEGAKLPELPAPGRWHTDGFFAAVLTARDLLAVDGGGDGLVQQETVQRFIKGAVAAGRSLVHLGGADRAQAGADQTEA